MSKAVQLLETMAQLAHADIEKLIAQTTINTELAEAIRAKDIISLERQLDICPDIYCVLFPAEDDSATETEAPTEDENNDEEVSSAINF